MILRAGPGDAGSAARLARLLWPDSDEAELEREFDALLADGRCAVFLCVQAGEAVAFAQCQLRSDYVEGTGSSPVGYLEGIYVKEPWRRRGIARALLAACEQWAKEKGCAEFASDCGLDNRDSLDFHLNTGFAEANRIICFTKKLRGDP